MGNFPFAVAAGDFNGDGKPDLASANGAVPGSVSVLIQVPRYAGNGAGLLNISAGSIVGGLTTNIAVLVPGWPDQCTFIYQRNSTIRAINSR